MQYRIPIVTHQTETVVSNSRFIATTAFANTVQAARAFIDQIRAAMPDANHHVYAFHVGHGNSVQEGMSDDGEPSGTAGPPVLAVVRGADIGDIVAVVTRYFGGTKLGTGGLVRAYSDAIRENLASLPTELKIEKRTIGIDLPYSFYEQVKRLITENAGLIEDESFQAEVSLIVRLPAENVSQLTAAIIELSAGQIQPILLD